MVPDDGRVFPFVFFQRPLLALEVHSTENVSLLQSPMANQAPFPQRQGQVSATVADSDLLLLRKMQMLMLLLLLLVLSSVLDTWLLL